MFSNVYNKGGKMLKNETFQTSKRMIKNGRKHIMNDVV
jgi:hypothetical protein